MTKTDADILDDSSTRNRNVERFFHEKQERRKILPRERFFHEKQERRKNYSLLRNECNGLIDKIQFSLDEDNLIVYSIRQRVFIRKKSPPNARTMLCVWTEEEYMFIKM